MTWSPRAEQQLDEALAYIAEDDPRAARRWLDRVLDSVARLALFPDSGRPVPEYRRGDIREIVVGPYRVMYRRRDDRVEVAAVRHAARRRDPRPD